MNRPTQINRQQKLRKLALRERAACIRIIQKGAVESLSRNFRFFIAILTAHFAPPRSSTPSSRFRIEHDRRGDNLLVADVLGQDAEIAGEPAHAGDESR